MSGLRIWRHALAAYLGVVLVLPPPAWGDSLGTARGVRGGEASFDDGRSWLPLATQPLPVIDGFRVRSRTGAALIDLGDGTRLRLHPFGVARIRQLGLRLEVSLLEGRLTFRIPPSGRLVIATPLARLEPLGGETVVGDAVAGPPGAVAPGLTGVRLSQGQAAVHEVTGEQRVMLAGLEPIFLPRSPLNAADLFAVPAPNPPPGARSVFTPAGENLGYLRPDTRLVVQPGFAADLTRPFPAPLVRTAMAAIPEGDRADALPLFDVNAGYVGYVNGSSFRPGPYLQVAQANAGDGQGGTADGSVWPGLVAMGSVVAVGGSTWLFFEFTDGDDDDRQPATRIVP